MTAELTPDEPRAEDVAARPDADVDPPAELVLGASRDIAVSELEPANAGDAARRAEPQFTLNVSVRHCSLEHAPYRLLIGHFQGLPLSGGESRLNERSDGRLERLLLMNQYPQRLGELALFDPVDEAPPKGMVVIGLGPSGELTSAELRVAVARALLRVALNELDRQLAAVGGGPIELRALGVSSVPIGSSPSGGLPVDASVRALLDGVVTANNRLARMKVLDDKPATDLVRFDLLELTERYEDRVDLIVGVLARLRRLDRRSRRANHRVKYVRRPFRGEGASSANPPIDSADEVWRRIDIRATRGVDEAVAGLEFTSIGRLARAERLLEPVERNLIEPLLAQAINDPADSDISGTLYELLIPHELKGDLGSSEHLHLLLDETTGDWPWELLRPRGDEEDGRLPLALRVGVLRQFREAEVRFDVRRATGNNALVIGNPPVIDALPLPGAAAECETTAKAFHASGWEVESRIWPDVGATLDEATVGRQSMEVVNLLLNGDWRVVHIAAHGTFTDDPDTTGVLLGPLRLTANTFSDMSVVPDLVIVNACHLGRVGVQRSLAGANRAAASVGRSLLQLGVRAAVVAGWAVQDDAAQSFAERLTTGLLSGEDFGTAVTEARRDAHRTAPSSLTWGAYQCYGDPGFSLARRSTGADRSGVYTVGELRRRTRRLASSAGDQDRVAMTGAAITGLDVAKELRRLERWAHCLGAAEVYPDLADVAGDLLDLDGAIRLYEAALADGGSSVPVGAVEQLGNLLSRRARRIARDTGDRAAAERDVIAAEQWLGRAQSLGLSGERHALVGGHHKRVAAMAKDDAERWDHLLASIAAYAAAQHARPSDYHALNWLQLVEIARLHRLDIAPAHLIPGAVRREDGQLVLTEPAPRQHPPISNAIAATDFWHRAAVGDRLLTAIIIDARLHADKRYDPGSDGDEDVQALETAYVAAFRLRSNARERATVLEHLRDLVDLIPMPSALGDRLRLARQRLEAWPRNAKD